MSPDQERAFATLVAELNRRVVDADDVAVEERADQQVHQGVRRIAAGEGHVDVDVLDPHGHRRCVDGVWHAQRHRRARVGAVDLDGIGARRVAEQAEVQRQDAGLARRLIGAGDDRYRDPDGRSDGGEREDKRSHLPLS